MNIQFKTLLLYCRKKIIANFVETLKLNKMKEWIKKKWNVFKAFFTSNVLWSIIIVLCCVVAIIHLDYYYSCKPIVTNIIIPVLTAIIAGFVVSLVIDIKKQVADIQELIVKSFTKNAFLEHLEDDDISKLREDALGQLLAGKYPNMQSGLRAKDTELSDALTKPYYEVFRETGVYSKHKKFSWTCEGTAEDVLFRNVDIQYTLRSPKSKDDITTADLSIGKSLQIPLRTGTPKDYKDIFKILQFYIIIDGKIKIDIANDLLFQASDLSSIEDYYNQKICISYDGVHQNIRSTYEGKTGVFVDFHESIEVHINYDIYLPLEDNHFTNRLKYPAKSFRLDCLCDDDDNVRFYGELLGTFTKISQVKTTHPKDNIMSIEALDWLLPRNGVFVVMCEKK